MNLPKYVDIQALTQADVASNANQQLEGATIQAIVTQANAGASITGNISYGSATQDYIEDLISRLRHEGYRVVPGASNMTVSWVAYFANPIS